MKRPYQIVLAFMFMLATVAPSHATVLVDDTWADGTRTDPAPPVYSEDGTDADGDGDLESAWFNGGGGTMTASLGDLSTTVGSSSSSWTTYFTPETSQVTLAGAGDELKITWVFTPTSVATSGTSQGLRLAVVDSPSASRLTADGSPGSSIYTGYAMFMNMATTLGSSSSFQLMGRSASGAFLSDSGTWANKLVNGAGKTVTGYASGTQYTFVMTFTRNAADGLDITATMTGGNLNNTGMATVSYTDNAPNTFTFDTFGVRPSDAADSAAQFDTALFQVEFIPGTTAPSITRDPQDQSVFVGQSATFSVLAAGTAPLSYQWYFNINTPVPLADATNASVTLNNLQTTNSDNYFVVVANAFGSVTSDVAALTVTVPNPPSIITQPQDQYISTGGTATFSVTAGGSEPLSYQWYYNTNTVLTNATDSTLIINNVQPGVTGSYSVIVSNLAGGIASSYAYLTINTTPVAPVFSSEPVSQVVVVGSTATFTALATGTAPIYYQWNKNGAPISGATTSTLTLANVQVADSGSSYTVTASNSVNSVTSSPAVLTVTTTVPVANSDYDLTGFAQGTTGGGVISDTDPTYVKVYTPLDFANALQSAYKTAGSVKVIEIMNDLNLGWNEVGSAVQAVGPFRENATPLLHPVLLNVGESLIDIKPRSGLTIFSANGATIKHCNFNIKSCSNVIIRNLKFDENWEWDESTKGQYDRNDWDFITVGNGGAVNNLWVDHCTFTKSYDGILDTKAGCSAITVSWCHYAGDDGATNTNSWVWQQINYLEQSPSSYPMYNFLRTRGFSTTNIVTIMQGHDKTQLAGQNDLDANNATITMTCHHSWFNNCWDRVVPRLRAGNVHDYDIYVDDTLVLAAKRLRDSIAATMSTADQNTLNNTYDFDPPVNGTISTENGAILVQDSVYVDCLWPLRNNQTDPSNPEYTGKIEALNSIYHFDNTDGTTIDFQGDSTSAPGSTYFGPAQAPVIPFSWNLPDNQLPYTYTPDDPGQLKSIVATGAGAGVLTWDKTNWLMTSYAPTAPFIVAEPQDATVTTNQSATFSVLAGGSATLNYQWYFNTNTPVSNATNSILTLTNIQTTDAGVYSVVVSNSTGSAISSNAVLNVSNGMPARPQLSGLSYNNGTFSLTINGDAEHNYTVQASTNLTDWTDSFTTNPAALPFTWNDSDAGNFNRRFYRVQVSP